MTFVIAVTSTTDGSWWEIGPYPHPGEGAYERFRHVDPLGQSSERTHRAVDARYLFPDKVWARCSCFAVLTARINGNGVVVDNDSEGERA